MSYRVIDPHTQSSTVFPSEQIAKMYARGIKGAIVEPCDTVCKAEVQSCPKGTLEAQREASRSHHLAARAGRLYQSKVTREARVVIEAEHAAEARAESFAEAQVATRR